MIKNLFKFTKTRFITGVETTIETSTFTSSRKPSTYDGNTYAAKTMSMSRPEQKDEISSSSVKIRFSLRDEFAREWLDDDASILKVEIFEEEDSTVSPIWRGRLVNTEIQGNETILNFESIFSSLRNVGLNRIFQRSCNHDLFGVGCGAVAADFVQAGGINAFSATDNYKTVQVPTAALHDDDYFTLGTIVDDNGNSRMIAKHVGDLITMVKPCKAFKDEYDLTGPVQVHLYPGCNKSREQCHEKFDVVESFGAFPYIPEQDIFDNILVI